MKKKILIFMALCTAFLFNAAVAQAQYSKLVVSINGIVKDAVTQQPVDIVMEVYDGNGKIMEKKKVKAANNGKYFITGLKPGGNYSIKFVGDNYLNQDFEVNIPNTDKYAEFSRDFLVNPRQIGAKIKIKVPPFELNKKKLRAGSNFFLEDNIELLKRNRSVKVELVCYSDNNKNPEKNMELTSGRCESLKDFFVANGIAPDRITVRPENKTDPENPPPADIQPKGKRYIGSIYFVIKSV